LTRHRKLQRIEYISLLFMMNPLVSLCDLQSAMDDREHSKKSQSTLKFTI